MMTIDIDQSICDKTPTIDMVDMNFFLIKSIEFYIKNSKTFRSLVISLPHFTIHSMSDDAHLDCIIICSI